MPHAIATASASRPARASRNEANAERSDTRGPASAATGISSNRERILLLDRAFGGASPRRRPMLGAPDSPHEREADRWSSAHAADASRATTPSSDSATLAPLARSPWRPTLHAQWGGGVPLGDSLRHRLQMRAGADLSDVRLHRSDDAVETSSALGASAWTLGSDIFFGNDAPSPESAQGERFLAHEIAHTLQQGGGGGLTPGLSAAPYQIQRQTPPVSAPASAAPTFSVDQAIYRGQVNNAIAAIDGTLVNNETLATTVRPILAAMARNLRWKDAQGNLSGGGAIQHTIGSTTLNLTLTLNDDPDPLRPNGLFHHAAGNMTDAEIELFIRKSPTADQIAQTLYHESMHLASWLLNRPTPALGVRAAGRSGPSGAASTLNMTRYAAGISTVRLHLDALAQSVNGRRGSGAQIASAQLDEMARWLVEEVTVRSETEVFRQAQATQDIRASARGASGGFAYIVPTLSPSIDASMVDRYVFDFSRVFLAADRTGLTAVDRQTLTTLEQILAGIYSFAVRRRFSPSPYLIGIGMPRAPVSIPLPPLVPPRSFGPPPLP